MLGIVFHPHQGWGQLVLFHDLRGQVLGHVGDGGVVIDRQLRTKHYRSAFILLVDPDAAPAPVRPIASVVVDVVVGLLHEYSSSPAYPWSSQAVSSMASLVAPLALKWATPQPSGRRSAHTSGALLSSR